MPTVMKKKTTYHRRPVCNGYCEAVWDFEKRKWVKVLNERGQRFLAEFHAQWGGRILGLLRTANRKLFHAVMRLDPDPDEVVAALWEHMPVGLCRWNPVRAGWGTVASYTVQGGAAEFLRRVETAKRLPVKYSLDFEGEDERPVASADLLSGLAVDPAETGHQEARDRAREVLAVARRILNKRYYQTLVMRFGLDGHPPMSLHEVGVRLGVTKERVRQMQSRACLALQRRLAAGGEAER